jgi:hypothetical protein
MYFVAPAWMGGIYATPASPGSRPGGLIAATWFAYTNPFIHIDVMASLMLSSPL